MGSTALAWIFAAGGATALGGLELRSCSAR
jgi:hypothetical protein